MDSNREEDLKMVCPLGKKEVRKLEVPADLDTCQRGTKRLVLDFSLSDYHRDGVFVFKPLGCFRTAALLISLDDIGGQPNGGGVISNA